MYRRVFTWLNFGDTATSWADTGVTISNIKLLVKCCAVSSYSGVIPIMAFRAVEGGAIRYWTPVTFGGTTTLIAEYTKTTD